MARSRRWRRCAAALALLPVLSACQGFDFGDWFKKDLPEEPKAHAASKRDPVFADTVGDVAQLGESMPLRLRGFGVVVGLGENGGTDCPTPVREYLLEYFGKEFAPKGSGERRDYSPQKLLDSRDSAVVSVTGMVPAGAPTGTIFDVQIEALGSDTRSIEGGRLLPCELKIFDVDASGTRVLSGRTMAKARGVIFTNPFQAAGEVATAGFRRGSILGGGRSTETRGVKLLLEEPSYNTARRIERRLNERLGPSPRVAEARSAGEVALTTPPAFADRPDRMVELASHVLLDGGIGYNERRMKELSEALGAAGPRLADVSLIWEGAGRSILPQIQPLYSHTDGDIAYYAARAGLRLHDASAVAVVGQAASNPSSPHRLEAVRELGACGLQPAMGRLAPLLDADDQEVRIAAYQALLTTRHSAIQSVAISSALDRSQIGLILDVMSTRGKPMIYVRRSREPRIAIFGAKMPVNMPVFYNHPQDWVTLNASDERGDITLFCRTRHSRQLSDKIMVPPRVDELIRAMALPPIPDDKRTYRGIGLHYSLIVHVLDELCRNGTIPARLVMEQTPLSDLLGPAAPSDRPETEADKPGAPPPPEKGADKPSKKNADNPAAKDRPE